ncbi:MAG: hypothetical protein KatS3mg005_0885 [Bryobacteraceae bacterium]|nr:MAG: hypothetical protein KatS3mg005_0885 [Bryobacteraceae bacterium]
MNPVDPFEQQMREAFRRAEPPAGLEQKILRRVQARQPRRLPRWFAAAAGLLIAVGGSLGVARWQEQRQREREAERVRQQLALTLEITSRTLAKADRRLRSIGVERIRVQEAPSWQE